AGRQCASFGNPRKNKRDRKQVPKQTEGRQYPGAKKEYAAPAIGAKQEEESKSIYSYRGCLIATCRFVILPQPTQQAPLVETIGTTAPAANYPIRKGTPAGSRAIVNERAGRRT